MLYSSLHTIACVCNVTYLVNVHALIKYTLYIQSSMCSVPYRGPHKLSDVQKCLEQAAASDARVYNFTVITEERKWVQVRERERREERGELQGRKGWWGESPNLKACLHCF